MVLSFDLSRLLSPEGGVLFFAGSGFTYLAARVKARASNKRSEAVREGNLLAAMTAFQDQITGELAACKKAHRDCLERAEQHESRIEELERIVKLAGGAGISGIPPVPL